MNKLKIDERVCVAVVCTGHVTARDAELIPCLVWDNYRERGEFWISSTAYGWLFRICALPEEWENILEEKGISSEGIANMKRLEADGYDWLHFQSDAPIVEGLHHWDW